MDPVDIDREALSALSCGLYIVTSYDGDKLNGFISNTVVQVTGRPPRIAVTVGNRSLTHEYIARSGVFAVSVLDDTAALAFIGPFGFRSGRDVDKLARVEYTLGETGCPVVTEHALTVIEARVVVETDVVTHTIFVGDVVTCRSVREGSPLTYAYYRETLKGKTPEGAPSYRPSAEQGEVHRTERRRQMQKYVCTLCGYVYDPAVGDPDNGVDPDTPFENVPDDWLCPICGAGKEDFEETD